MYCIGRCCFPDLSPDMWYYFLLPISFPMISSQARAGSVIILAHVLFFNFMASPPYSYTDMYGTQQALPLSENLEEQYIPIVTHVSRSGLKKFNLSHHDCSQVQKQIKNGQNTAARAAQQFPAESSRLGTVEVAKLQELRTKTLSNSPRLFSRLWCSVVLCFGRGRFYEHLCEPSQRRSTSRRKS